MNAVELVKVSKLVRLAAMVISSSLLTACLEIGEPNTDGAQASAIGAPTTPPVVNFSASPASVPTNGSTALNWSSEHATSCSASGDWSGIKAPTGSETVAALNTDSTFTLTCSGNGGSTSRSVLVTITSAPEPTVTFTAEPTTVVYGQRSTLQWDSTNADSCTGSGGWSGNKGRRGNSQTDTLTGDTTYTLTCEGPGGRKTESVTLTVTEPPPASPTLSLSANPTSIGYLGSTTVSWAAGNVTSCTASGGWSGSKAASGSQNFGNLTSDRTYTLSCVGDGGSITRSVTVAVAPPPAPTLSLSASPTSVAYNGTSVLSWSTSNATSCSASGNWSGIRGTSGAETVGPLTSNASYTLSCSGSGGSITRTVALAVQAPSAPAITLSANPSTVAAGSSTTLNWSATNADSCTASGAWSGSKGASGSQSVGPINSTSTFTLTCTGPGGTNSGSRTVSIAPAPSVTLSANPTSVQSGGSTTLTWSSTNATSCSASGAWSGNKGTSGTETMGSLTSDSTYTLVCTGSGGSTTRSTTVTIATAALRSVLVSWDAPTTRTDGSLLTNLAGYRIHYGTASGSYTQMVNVDNPSLNSYAVDNLTNGTYYFSVTAYDDTAMESDYSLEVSVTLN